MPVLGHAFVGLATAIGTRPRSSKQRTLGTVLWIPTVVGLAYLPDIVGQLVLLAGREDWQVAPHSVVFALAAAVLLSLPLAVLGGVGFRRAFGVSLLSVLLHDVLDLLQGTDRQPWWPLSDRHARLEIEIVPTGVFPEILLFGWLLALFLLGRRITARSQTDAATEKGTVPISPGTVPVSCFEERGTDSLSGRNGDSPRASYDPGIRLAAIGYTLTAMILMSAAVTHYLKGVRREQSEQAAQALKKGDAMTALALLDEAGRWPAAPYPGRMDYWRASAYLRLGDRRRAEEYYLRCLHADPSHFWCLVDLADLYASSDAPEEQRRRQTAPYLRRMRGEFSTHKHLPRILAKLERKLSSPSPSEAAATRPPPG